MPQLVLVHGFLGSSLNWGPVLTRLREAQQKKELSELWQIKAIDLIGHAGRKLAPGQTLNLETTVDDLITQLPEGKIIALGHSFGLRPLLKLVGRMPDKVAALIVEDASPDLSDYGYQFLKGIFTKAPASFASKIEAKNYFDQTYGADSPMSRFLLSQIRQTPDGSSFAWRFDREKMYVLLEDSYAHPLWKEWEEYRGPIHMIVGQNSQYMTSDRVERCRLSRQSLSTQIVQIPNAAHWVHSEQLDLFSVELIKMLKLINAAELS